MIVDAHSVIFAWPELRQLHSRRTLLAREALVKALTEYQDVTGIRAVAVFDGQGETSSGEQLPGGIQIFYSAAGQTADSIVERLAAKYASEHELIVVTDDIPEQETVTSFGATALSTGLFKQMLEEAEADLQRQIQQRRRQE
jgi:hypothetical protein